VNVYFHTFGCKANQYDTERVRQAFDASGATVVDDPAFADLAVINSCTVTNESEVKLRRLVRHVANSGHAQTIVMGCAAALDSGAIAALPSVRAVVANAEPDTVLRAAGFAGSVEVACCAPTCGCPLPRSPQDPGRLRRALHLLRDDTRARQQSLATRG